MMSYWKNYGWVTLLGLAIMLMILGAVPRGTSVGRFTNKIWRSATFWAPDAVSGQVVSTGDSGTYTLHPTSCYSEQPSSTNGIGFRDDDQSTNLAGRVVVPESDDPHVVLNIPNTKLAYKFHSDQCPMFDIDVHRTGGRFNGVWNMAGRARFECNGSPEPGKVPAHVKGDLTFRWCH